MSTEQNSKIIEDINQDNLITPNKLGITDEDIINKIVQYKMNIINSTFTFNEEERGLDYLKKIHGFLFGDIFYDAGVFSKRITDEVIKELDTLIKEINELFEFIDYEETFEEIKNKMKELIDLQLFNDGNNRTISTYCRIILEDYNKNKSKGSI